MDLDIFHHDPLVEQYIDSLFPSDTHDFDPDLHAAQVYSLRTDDADPRARPDLCSISMPPISEVLPTISPVLHVPTPIYSLYVLPELLSISQLSAVDFYQSLAVNQVLLSPRLPPRAHVDGGSMANTTNRLDYLFFYHEFTPEELQHVPRFRVANDATERPVGYGYTKVPIVGHDGHMFQETFYTPTLPATIFSPDVMGRTLGCTGYYVCSDFVNDDESVLTLRSCGCGPDDGITDVIMSLRRIRGLLYSVPLIKPTDHEHSASYSSVRSSDNLIQPICTRASLRESSRNSTDVTPFRDPDLPIRALTREQQRTLWHMRLGHTNDARVAQMHRYADGIPSLPRSDVLHKCPLCTQAKLHKASRVAVEPDTSTECWQHVHMDFGFFVQKSKNRKRFESLKGLAGETCYVLLTDRKSGAWQVAVRVDKRPPLDFVKKWLARYGSLAKDRSVRFDLGGELGRCKAIHDLFEAAGYRVDVTAPDSSNENGQVERPHRTIGDAVRTMLFAAALPAKYWPYALKHFVLLSNLIPRGNREEPPITICTGVRPDLRLLRVFGCSIFVLPAKKRFSKLNIHSKSGIFLGFQKTFRHAYYLDHASGKVLTGRHIAFDEGMNSTDSPPPFARLLKGLELLPPEKDVLDLDKPEDRLDVSLSPFTDVETVQFPLDFSKEHPLGFQIAPCSRQLRAFAHTLTVPPHRYQLRSAQNRFQGGYILALDDVPVFSTDDVRTELDRLRALSEPPIELSVTIAADLLEDLRDSRAPPLHLRAIDLRRICALNIVAGEGMKLSTRELRQQVRDIASAPPLGYTPADPDDLVTLSAFELLEMRRLQVQHMTDEERKLKSFTRRNLMQLPNWQEWRDADDKQLNAHWDSGTFGKPVKRKSLSTNPDDPSQVFRLQWARLIKSNGDKKARACLDGSKRAAPFLRMHVQTYASCIELPGMRIFFAVCAARGLIVYFADVVNAFQQAPPPSIACFIRPDEAIIDWYFRKFGIKLDPDDDLIPLLRALQGHPEAGVLWERMITDIVINKMKFKNTIQERSLYIGVLEGMEILACRQVDDFATGSSKTEGNRVFFRVLSSYVKTELYQLGIVQETSAFSRFNGIDVHQTQDFIKLDCKTYIDRVLLTHGWDTPENGTTDPANLVPLRPDKTDALMRLEGPPEKTPEARELVKKHQFSYRNLLGELIYAYVICRIDIGYAVCFLARFSQAPHDGHFVALKHVAKYLRKTRDWGLIYWRPKPLMELPKMHFQVVPPDPSLPTFPVYSFDELIAFLDAAHATDIKTRRSVAGLVACLCGAAIAYKSRLIPTVATSSTEAEFLSAVMCAKIVKYLRSILQGLDFLRPSPTRLLIDNEAALAVINEKKPTPRSRHIDVQHFAIQEWAENKDIIMEHIAGVINPSDDLTKALGWLLHSRHARRHMGHYGPPC